MAQAPTPEVPAAKRLTYFVRFLEFPDQLVSNDAYAEFANAPYKDIAAVASKLPHEKIRQWIVRPETPQPRLGLYGMMLGLCGDNHDATAPGRQDFAEDRGLPHRHRRPDLRLSVADRDRPGLEHIDEWKFKDRKVPFSETYAAMMGLRFMWQYASGRIPNERLMQSMRILLDRPELADLVIADLARWNDWSVQDRLMDIYGKGEYNIPSIKRAIIRYMLASTQTKSAARGQHDRDRHRLRRAVGRRTRVRQSSARRLPRVCRARQAVPGPAAEARSEDGQGSRTVLLRELNRDHGRRQGDPGRDSRVRLRRLAPVRFSRQQRAGPARPGTGSRRRRLAPLFLFDPRTGRAAKARPPHRARRPSTTCPGSKTVYLRWQELEAGLRQLVGGMKTVAMEYSPRNGIPYVSRVDAGTVELVRSFGVDVVSSGDLIQLFEAAWDDEQERSHFEAAVHTDSAYARAWRLIAAARSRNRIGRRERSAGRHPEALRRTRHGNVQPADRGGRPALGRSALRNGDGRGDAHPRRRFRADRPVGQVQTAAGRLQRSDPRGLRRQNGAAEVHGDFPDRRQGPRRGDRNGPLGLRRRPDHSGLGKSTGRPAT